MADKLTQYYLDASEQGHRRDAAVNAPGLERKLRYAEFDITFETGFITAADNYVLGALLRKARIVPALSYLVGLSGALAGVFVLEKVKAAGGTPTAVSGNTTLATDGTAVALGAIAAGFPAVEPDDYLQLTIGTATAVANGDTAKLIVAYLSDDEYSN